MNEFLKVGHRGAYGYEPENTLRSFEKAIELGTDMVELDVHVCKTGEPIVIHDETVDRTSDGHGRVSELSLQSIKQLKLPSNEKIPTLQEVIDICRSKVKINIEIKESMDADAALRVIKRNDAFSWVMISSNYTRPLQQAFTLDHRLTTALIFYSTKTDLRDILFASFCLLIRPIAKRIMISRAKKAGASWVNIMRFLATKSFISTLHNYGFKVCVWTVDKPSQIKKMRQYGVDAIISNYPDRL